MPKVFFYKGAEVIRTRAQKRGGRKTGYIRVTLKGPPVRKIMVSFPDWKKYHTVSETS
jgi:hypothetical protein